MTERSTPSDPRPALLPAQPSRSTQREEHVTSTGWRVVGGKAVSLVAEAATTAVVPVGRNEDVLYAAKFQMRPRLLGGSAIHAALIALGGAIARDWTDAPPLTRDRPLNRAPGRFHGLRWETHGERDSWIGELVWRHPHPVVAGAPCTTHVVLTEQSGYAALTVRIAADGGFASVRGMVGAGQARPAFLAELNRAVRLTFDGGDCEPRLLGDLDIDRFVRDVLLDESRDHPVAVLAPLEEGGYLVPPAELAEELLGLAHLYVLERHPTTFRLTDSLGDRRLSCYWGAIRVYMPGFSCADRGEDHPLLIRDRVPDPVIRADLAGKLGRFARVRVSAPGGITERRRSLEPPPATAPAPTAGVVASIVNEGAAPVSLEIAATAVAAPLGAPAQYDRVAVTAVMPPLDFAPLVGALSPLLAGLGAQLGDLSSTIARLVEANGALSDEVARLRTTTAVRAGNTSSLERRIGGIEQLLQQQFAPSDARAGEEAAPDIDVEAGEERQDDDVEHVTLVDVLRQAATAHPDALLLLDAAERSAAESPYVDVDRLAVILDAMAGVARRRQEGALGAPLRTAFRELGIEYRGGITQSTSEKHRRQYLVRGPDGAVFDCHEHIVLGTSYDPRYCLRVYFTSRAPVEPRFVIGHVGRHFDVLSTT